MPHSNSSKNSFNRFRQEYNEQRPHEALDQKTPASQYQSSPRHYPERLPELNYPDYYDVKKVSSNGVVYWRNNMVYISHLLKEEWVGIDQIDNGLWAVHFGPIELGRFNERQKETNRRGYLSIKV